MPIQYLAHDKGQKFKLPLGDDELIVQVPGVQTFVDLLALETRNMQQRQELAGYFGEEPEAADASFAGQFNRELVQRVIVRPTDFDYGDLSSPAWAYLRPILRKLAGVDGTVVAPDADELFGVGVGQTYRRRMGPVTLTATVPRAADSDRLRGLRPSLLDDPDDLETKWHEFAEGVITTTEAMLLDSTDSSLGTWREWSAPRLAAVYDVLMAVTGLTVSQFRAEAHLEPVDDADLHDLSGDEPAHDGYAEPDVGDDSGRADSAESSDDDGSGNDGAETDLAGSEKLGLSARRH